MHYLSNNDIHYNGNLIKLLEAELQTLPQGSMINKNKKYYYYVIKSKETCITKNEKRLAQYCRKSFITFLMKHLVRNGSSPGYQYNIQSAKAIIESLPKSYQGFPLHYYFHSEYATWLKLKKLPNQLHSKGLKYPSKNSNILRSKSELVITNFIEDQKIPFIYEMPFKINNKTLYPDFLIICPYTGQLKIWEHFGLLSDPIYEKKMKDKIVLYHKLGFKLFENVIYTFESDIVEPKRIAEITAEIILNPKF